MDENHCARHFAESHLPLRDRAREMLDQEVATFQSVAERALIFRETAMEAAAYLKDKQARGVPLSGFDLDELNKGVVDYLAARTALWDLASRHECWLEMTPAQRQAAGIGEAELRTGTMQSLAAGLILYDNYLLAISLFEQDKKLRSVINTADSGYRKRANRLNEVTLSFFSATNRSRMRRGIRFYQNLGQNRSADKVGAHDDYLVQLIEQSPSYYALQQRKLPAPLLGQIDLLTGFSLDTVTGLTQEGVNLFSMLFGNTIGLVETRRGRLYGHDKLRKRLLDTLQPGDILLEKTPFRLTDALIPGYWGHAAIWTGTEAELRALGLWDHAVIEPHHQSVQEQRHIIEALRSGVKINRLERFMNIDDLVILRPRQQTPEEQAARIVRAFRQIGKAYDFNFDVETTDRIVCSELVYQVYTDITWPTSRTLGRTTISPDQIVQKVEPDGPLEVVSLYLDGRAVGHDRRNRLKLTLK